MIVTKIVLVIDGKETCIDIKDAEKLYKDLDKVFGKKEFILPDVGKIYPQPPRSDEVRPPFVWYTLSSGGKV